MATSGHDAEMGSIAGGGMSTAAKLALAAAGGGALRLLAWSWMAFADSIYLTRLAAIVASCL